MLVPDWFFQGQPVRIKLAPPLSCFLSGCGTHSLFQPPCDASLTVRTQPVGHLADMNALPTTKIMSQVNNYTLPRTWDSILEVQTTLKQTGRKKLCCLKMGGGESLTCLNKQESV